MKPKENRKNISEEDGLKNLILQELKENPYRKFNIAFSLMTIIPFLAFVYILINISSSDAMIGQVGGILILCLIIAFCGFSVGYVVISSILKRLFSYAKKSKHSDQLKSTAIALVSHELKNPITIVKTNLETLADGLLGEITGAQKEVVQVCLKVSDRMTSLVNDLLDLHKIEAGMMDMKRECCDLSKILESQVGQFESLTGKKGIKMVMELLDANLMVWADGGKIEQVINNLLSNAIKHSPSDQPVTVMAYPVEHFIRLEVADKGPGIPPDKLEKVFDKFERLDAVREGTGLGLAIAKDIVELHKGRIWAESLPGKGSTFVVVLPRDLRSLARSKEVNF
jgi:signal transduction histidine kinase